MAINLAGPKRLRALAIDAYRDLPRVDLGPAPQGRGLDLASEGLASLAMAAATIAAQGSSYDFPNAVETTRLSRMPAQVREMIADAAGEVLNRYWRHLDRLAKEDIEMLATLSLGTAEEAALEAGEVDEVVSALALLPLLGALSFSHETANVGAVGAASELAAEIRTRLPAIH